MTALPELARRMSRAIEADQGIDLDSADVALLASIGATALIDEAAEFEINPRDFPVLEIGSFCPDCSPWVYFMQAGEAGPIKIGLTVNLKQRLTEHQTSNPERLAIHAAIAGPPSNERVLHRFYKREWIRGEWFRPSLRLRAFVDHVAAGST